VRIISFGILQDLPSKPLPLYFSAFLGKITRVILVLPKYQTKATLLLFGILRGEGMVWLPAVPSKLVLSAVQQPNHHTLTRGNSSVG
jgi:hypothetical protein